MLLSYIILFLISGVLVLIPNYPVVNILLTSFIFACAAHEINLITNILVKILVPDNNFKVVLRNTFLFIAILIPIGIQDGMFWKEVWNDFLHLLKVQYYYQGVLSRPKSSQAWKSFLYVTKKVVYILQNSYYRNPTKEKLVLPTLLDWEVVQNLFNFRLLNALILWNVPFIAINIFIWVLQILSPLLYISK